MDFRYHPQSILLRFASHTLHEYCKHNPHIINPVICYSTKEASRLFRHSKCPQVSLVKWSATNNAENKLGHPNEYTLTVEQSGASVHSWYHDDTNSVFAGRDYIAACTSERCLHLIMWNKHTPINMQVLALYSWFPHWQGFRDRGWFFFSTLLTTVFELSNGVAHRIYTYIQVK